MDSLFPEKKSNYCKTSDFMVFIVFIFRFSERWIPEFPISKLLSESCWPYRSFFPRRRMVGFSTRNETFPVRPHLRRIDSRLLRSQRPLQPLRHQSPILMSSPRPLDLLPSRVFFPSLLAFTPSTLSRLRDPSLLRSGFLFSPSLTTRCPIPNTSFAVRVPDHAVSSTTENRPRPNSNWFRSSGHGPNIFRGSD